MDRLKERRYVETARKSGVMIVNDGTGYYQTNNIQDIERQYKKDEKRAMTILTRLKHMRDVMEGKNG